MDWRLETVVVPVSDVDRAKAFYADAVGFHVDVDHSAGEDFRVVQFTPRGSGCSISLMRNEDAAGTLQGLQLVVRDLDEARRRLLDGGVDVPGLIHFEDGAPVDGPQPGPGRLRDVPLVQRSRRQRLDDPRGPEPPQLTRRCAQAGATTRPGPSMSTSSAVGCGGPSARTQRTNM